MLDFLNDFLIKPFTDGLIGVIMALLMWGCLLSIIGLILWGSLELANSSFLPVQEGSGEIIKKKFIPEHTSMVMLYNAATKTSMPSYTHYPDEYQLKIKVGELTDKISVKRKTYDRLEVGQTLQVKYSIGRLWIKLYIKSFTKPWKQLNQ